KSDLVFVNSSGTYATWTLNNTAITGGGNLGSPGGGWSLVGASSGQTEAAAGAVTVANANGSGIEVTSPPPPAPPGAGPSNQSPVQTPLKQDVSALLAKLAQSQLGHGHGLMHNLHVYDHGLWMHPGDVASFEAPGDWHLG